MMMIFVIDKIVNINNRAFHLANGNEINIIQSAQIVDELEVTVERIRIVSEPVGVRVNAKRGASCIVTQKVG